MQFIEQANKHHPTICTIKFTAEISKKKKRHFWIQAFIKAKDSEASHVGNE